MSFVVVHMGDGQDHAPAGFRVSFTVPRATVGMLWRPFASVRGAEKQERPEGKPLGRPDRASGITLHPVRADRHQAVTFNAHHP